MNEDVKKLWIEDLRANGDKKCIGRLREGDGYCCLGRLCDLYVRSGHSAEWWCKGDYAEFEAGGNLEETELPLIVQKWAGLSDSNPEFYDGINAIDLNDGSPDDGIEPHSFDQIADLIEKHL